MGRVFLEEQNRIYHRSPMQTEKPQPEGQRIMPETRFTESPALSVHQRVGISRSASDDADQETPTRGSTDNAGNSVVYPDSGIIR